MRALVSAASSFDFRIARSTPNQQCLAPAILDARDHLLLQIWAKRSSSRVRSSVSHGTEDFAARLQVRCLSYRSGGAACSFARAASTCNYNGPFGDFFDQPKIADAVWDLFRDVFGIQKTSVRVVIGVASLPLGVPIGLDVIFEVAD